MQDPNMISYREAAQYVLSIIKEQSLPMPRVGIVCGSGLSGLSETMTNTYTIPYSAVPGFPAACTVPGHKGEMVVGLLSQSNVPCLCFRGRFHSYEGHSMNTTALPVRIMRCLSTIQVVILTNAAGGLNPDYSVGDIVCVTDYFALPMLTGKNPLMGKNDDEMGCRFPAMSNAFDPTLQDDVVIKAAEKFGCSDFVRKDGTYCFVSGPMYESKAECRFLRNMVGGDAVGMSTVPEITAAHHSGLKVICLSLITNKVIMSGDEGPAATHEEVLEAVNTRSTQIQSLVGGIVAILAEKGGYMDSLPPLTPISLHTVDDEPTKDDNNVKCSSGGHCRILGVPVHCIGMSVGVMSLTVLAGMALTGKKK